MSNLLEGFKRHTTIVADTGDLRAIERLTAGIRASAADTRKLEALVGTVH